MFHLCLFVCLFVCPPDYSKSYEQILMKFFGRMVRGPKNDRLDFGGDIRIQIFLQYSLFTVPIPIDSQE